MRNIPIPVDLSALTFVCVSAPRPKLVDQDTGEVKVNRNGETVFTVGLSAADASGRVDLLKVAVGGAPEVTVGEVVSPVGLVGYMWEKEINGVMRWGISYHARRIVPAPVPAPGPVSSSAPVSAAAGVA
ncbi:SCO3933 family regulatory protein [Actinomadura formosensis]|uniref:SCO3933 family regulatory protein n=1 Tax=Actinomadura formosensis TaxID=60706 RepID=UPI000837650E|nr:hypothetical protein [Actinomadura formosensis]